MDVCGRLCVGAAPVCLPMCLCAHVSVHTCSINGDVCEDWLCDREALDLRRVGWQFTEVVESPQRERERQPMGAEGE